MEIFICSVDKYSLEAKLNYLGSCHQRSHINNGDITQICYNLDIDKIFGTLTSHFQKKTA